MNALRDTRLAGSTSQIQSPLPAHTRSAPSSPHRHQLLSPLRPRNTVQTHGLSTLTTASQFTSIIQYAKAGSQKDLLSSQHALIDLQRDQLALDTARLEFEKRKHAEKMELKRSQLKIQRRLMLIKEHHAGRLANRLKWPRKTKKRIAS